MEDFGASGGNASLDGPALASAIAYSNFYGGGKIVGTPGRTYHFHRLAPVNVTAPLTIDLNGATFKRPDGVVTGTNQRAIHLVLGDGAALEMFGGTLDANYRNNPRPDGSGAFAWEQNTILFVGTASGAAVSHVTFHDLILKDREVFDQLRIIPASGSTIESLHVANVESQDAEVYGRGSIIWYRGIRSVLIENCPYLHAVETEFTSPEDPVETTVVIRDCTIGRLDLGFSGEATNKQCNLARLDVDTRMDAMAGAHFWSEDCTFVLGPGGGAYVRPPSWEAVNCEIHIPATGWDFAALAVSGSATCRFSQCLFRAEEGAAPEEGAMAILFPQSRSSDATKPDLAFDDCEFDLPGFSGIGSPSGKAAFRRNSYSCGGDWVFRLVAGSREQQVTVENAGDGLAVTGAYSLYLDNWDVATAQDYLELSGPWGTAKPITWVNGSPNELFEFRDYRTFVV